MARYGSFDPADNWQMVNLSPDFPTVGAVIAILYSQSGGTPVDGVIAVDPEGLAAMMRLTGPITVSGWPVPITSANVSVITQNKAYVTYAGTRRPQELPGDADPGGVRPAAQPHPARPGGADRQPCPRGSGGHLLTYSTHPSDQAYLTKVGLTGAVPPVAFDALELTIQNASANKID